MEDHVAAFAKEWFDELSGHEPVEELLAKIRDDGLEMVFPERTVTGHADFADWYAEVGKLYTDQTHVIEDLRTESHDDLVDVAVTVIWAGVENANGERFAFRVNQNWTLRVEPDGRLRIQRYRISDFTPMRAGVGAASADGPA